MRASDSAASSIWVYDKGKTLSASGALCDRCEEFVVSVNDEELLRIMRAER